MRTLRLVLLVALAQIGCSSVQPGPAVGDGDGAGAKARVLAAVPDDYPALGFDPRPDYIPDNVLVLTFDDGPDWTNTEKVLDVLKDEDVKASFFINTQNWSNVDTETEMQNLVRRMVDEGHELASHSVHHPHLPTLGASGVDDELSGVEDTVRNVLGSGAPRMTLFRAPFGEPYQDGNGYEVVAPVVAEHAVHIGWNFDTFDYNCGAGDSACVLNNFKNGVKTPGNGSWGIILMHSVNAQTPAALPAMIQYARDKGFEFWTVEQVVCARFDRSSSHIVDGTTGGCSAVPPPPDEPDAGVPPPDEPDADITDPPPPPPDEPDAGEGPNEGDDDPTGPMTGSCGCRAGGGSGGGAAAGLLLLAPVAVFAVRRRRRRHAGAKNEA